MGRSRRVGMGRKGRRRRSRGVLALWRSRAFHVEGKQRPWLRKAASTARDFFLSLHPPTKCAHRVASRRWVSNFLFSVARQGASTPDGTVHWGDESEARARPPCPVYCPSFRLRTAVNDNSRTRQVSTTLSLCVIVLLCSQCEMIELVECCTSSCCCCCWAEADKEARVSS